MSLTASVAMLYLLSFVASSLALSSPMLATNSANEYLSSLSRSNQGGRTLSLMEPLYNPPQHANAIMEVAEHPVEEDTRDERPEETILAAPTTISSPSFSHAPLSFFDRQHMTVKGPRLSADRGTPYDATRPFVSLDDQALYTGGWWCSAGGWPSPTLRSSTEVFFVLSGRGRVTDTDHVEHEFGPGDTVILPKGWSGRWDIVEDIHKVWFVHEHANIEEDASRPIRAVVTPYDKMSPQHLTAQAPMADVLHGSPVTASGMIYNVGPTKVGCWTCTPGSFLVESMEKTESFLVLEGTFFISALDGTAQRCLPGDVVVLPKGFSGYMDVIETMRKLWVVTD
jgi:uncharacterized cupin superfamily protein